MKTALYIFLLFAVFQFQNAACSPAMNDMEALARPIRSLFSDLALGSMTKTGSSMLAPMLTGAMNLLGSGSDDDYGNAMLPDVSSAPWHVLVGPFFRYVPSTVGEFCQCRGVANCGCCVGFYISPWQIRNNVCLNVSLGPEAFSHSQYSLHGRIIYDKTQILDISASEQEPPSVCLSLIPFTELQGCIKLANLHMDAQESKGCICGTMLLKWKESVHPIISLPTQCLCLGKPVPQHKKQFIFGLPPLLDMIEGAKNFIG